MTTEELEVAAQEAREELEKMTENEGALDRLGSVHDFRQSMRVRLRKKSPRHPFPRLTTLRYARTV